MAGVEKLKERILEEARLQAQNNIKRAEEQASEIYKAAREEADIKSRAIIEKAQNDALERKKRIMSYAALEARKQRLKAKQEMVDEAFEKALDRLKSLSQKEYMGILADMIVKSVGDGGQEVILSQKDREAMGASLVETVNKKLEEKGVPGRVRLSDETRELGGGFILKAGNVEMNNSFEAVIRMQRERLEAEVVQVLFGEGV